MKLNKLNIAIVGLSGMLSAPAFAQNFYQCMPVGCKPGYYGAPGACKACPAGEYSDTSNSTVCKKCPSGLVSDVGANKCQSCPAGYACDSNGFTACEWGTYSKQGELSCSTSPIETMWSGATTTNLNELNGGPIVPNSTPVKCPNSSCATHTQFISNGGKPYNQQSVYTLQGIYYSTSDDSPNKTKPYFGISSDTAGNKVFLLFSNNTPWKTVSKDSGGKWESEVSQYKSDIYHYLVVETNDTVKVYKANAKRGVYSGGAKYWEVQHYY